jgi:AcrR family transcriptional regulator
MPKPTPRPPDPARSEDKRRRIVEAATTLFSQYGFRRTSVDLIAGEAGVAKPTLYAYFTDKEAIFQAVTAHVCEGILARAEEASRRAGRLEDRITAVLAAKFTYLYDLVHSSPHAQEILANSDRLGADVVDKTDRAFARLLTRMIDEAAAAGEIDPRRVGVGAGSAASILMRCGHGAAFDAQSAQGHERHLAEMVRVVLSGMRSPPSK